MRTFNYRWFFLLMVFSFSGETLAAFYSWYSPNNPNVYGDSPMAACIKMNSGNATGMTFVMGGSGIDGTCLYNGVSYNGYIQRRGDSCPATGQTYNTTTGVCSCPAGTTSQAGQCVVLTNQPCPQDWSGGEKVWSTSKQSCVKYPNLSESEYCSYMGGKKNAIERTVNSNSPNGPEQYTDNTKCVTNADQQKAECVSRVNTDGTGQYKCKVTGTFSGSYQPNGSNMPDGFCPTGNCVDAPPVPPEPAKPSPQNNSSSDPCVYSSNASGGQTCTSTNNSSSEGTANCGTFNGVWGCQKTPPKNNGISITTNVSSTPNADGGTTTTKTDVATSTKCTDIGKCITGSTTTTTITKTNGSGQTTSVTGTCTGDQCPDKNGNPDGDGDGFGDCIGDECGTGSSGPAELPELEEQPTVAETTEAYFNRIKNAPIAQALSIVVPSGGSCAAGTAQTFFGSISFDSFCQLAPNVLAGLRYLFLAIWAWAAIRLFFTA